MSEWEVVRGDSLEVLRTLPDACVDAVITDPPAGISFMGREWDDDKGGRWAWIAWLAERLRECFRVLKPGGHALVWALPRTSHWTGTSIEDAGFEVRDRLSHLFGTGFPKSLHVSLQPGCEDKTGLGTALKPACEDWWLARKPLDGTVAANVLAHGTGALNIDACRIEFTSDADRRSALPGSMPNASESIGTFQTRDRRDERPEDRQNVAGRWPANVVLDETAAAMLDEQSGTLKSGALSPANNVKASTGWSGGSSTFVPNEGGASRFFYVAKPSGSERDGGLEHLPARSGGEATDRKEGSDGLKSPRAGAGRGGNRKNVHPTVKSIALMRWLVRLITPPGGLVLDPFSGSGSTGCAAVLEGCSFLGIEQEEEYVELARARITHWAKTA